MQESQDKHDRGRADSKVPMKEAEDKSPLQPGLPSEGVPSAQAPSVSGLGVGITAPAAITIYQAKAKKTHRTGAHLSQLFGVTPKAIRDIWNLRSWTLTTKPYWSEQDREKYESSPRNFRGGSAAAEAPARGSPPESPSLTTTFVEFDNPSPAACGAASKKAPGGKDVGLNELQAWSTSLPTLGQVQQSCSYLTSSATPDVSSQSRLWQLKRSRHSLSAVVPGPFEEDAEFIPPAKFQRVSSWSEMVRVSTSTSLEGATEMLCTINTSYSRLHLSNEALDTEVLNCPLDGVTLRVSNEPGKHTVVAVTPNTTSPTIYLSRSVEAPRLTTTLVSKTSQSIPTGGGRGELLSRILIHFLGRE